MTKINAETRTAELKAGDVVEAASSWSHGGSFTYVVLAPKRALVLEGNFCDKYAGQTFVYQELDADAVACLDDAGVSAYADMVRIVRFAAGSR